MRIIIQIISTILLLNILASAQGVLSYPHQSVDIHQQTPTKSFSLLDPDRFQIRQGFSMSMMSTGGQSIGIGAYSNEMSYLFTDNLKLHAGFTYMRPTGVSPLNRLQPLSQQLMYSATLEYKPTDSSLLQFSIQNYPTFFRQYQSPFIPGIEYQPR
ncbi:MAG: hypothetical protein ISS10_02560 [Candidatus Marinimicrobia bacterium]|nr:hypothetical protein [Candidatus Neomarinimicrobiota bacterium]MBL7059861.1 hypothetical protein [Candidatus Neomarinimicrobiota bacterium]